MSAKSKPNAFLKQSQRLTMGVIFPVLMFAVLAVPLDSYLEAFSQSYTRVNGFQFFGVFCENVFAKALGAIYCVTIVLEAAVILMRPHMKGGVLTILIPFVICLFAVAIFIIVKTQSPNELNMPAVRVSIIILMIFSCITSLYIHVIDGINGSSEISGQVARKRAASRGSNKLEVRP